MVSHDSATDTRIIGEVARLALAASTIFFVINIDDGPPLLRGKFRVAIERKRKRPTADYRFSEWPPPPNYPSIERIRYLAPFPPCKIRDQKV